MKLTLERLQVFLVSVVAFCSVAFVGGSPQKTIEVLLETMQGMKVGNDINREQKVVNMRLSAKALTFVDIETLSRKTLGKYWKERTSQEQEKFVSLMGKLFQKIAFPRSARFFTKIDVHYKKNRIEGDLATVPILITHEEEGEVGIDFILRFGNNQWQLIDVILDGVSMRDNLRSQFYKIISYPPEPLDYQLVDALALQGYANKR